MKIIFLGTSKFGAIILKKLADSGYSPALVVTAADKPSGRKQVIVSPPVKIMAQQYEINIIQPERVKLIRKKIEELQSDLIITAAYGQILPQEILDMPKFGSLNIHPSLLPKYRGPSPVQNTILNGVQETGVTIILMDSIMDHGPIVAQRKTTVGINETFLELHDRLGFLGAELLIDVIPDWITGRIKVQRQNEADATYTKIIRKEDGLIDWTKTPAEITRQVRALNPWPGTYTFWKKDKKNSRLKILEVSMENDKLVLALVQPEGKKPMDFAEFLRGNQSFKKNQKICSRIQI